MLSRCEDGRFEAGGSLVRVDTPAEFCFSEVLGYLGRSPDEALYRVTESEVQRWLTLLDTPVLLLVSSSGPGSLDVRVTGGTDARVTHAAAAYVREWFDLDRNLGPFYRLAAADSLLAPLVVEFYGLRLISVPDLFEALCWAVIGQQINLRFAYLLKRRFVQAFGVSATRGSEVYWQFPAPQRVAALERIDLHRLQLTERKSEYIIDIAQRIACGTLTKADLLSRDRAEAKRMLTAIRGVGDWTASYVAMRCLRDASAFPVGDVGLQNAVKRRLGADRKPNAAELLAIGSRWAGWEAYATFYLWRSLQGLSA